VLTDFRGPKRCLPEGGEGEREALWAEAAEEAARAGTVAAQRISEFWRDFRVLPDELKARTPPHLEDAVVSAFFSSK
jgi:hypothetical protein